VTIANRTVLIVLTVLVLALPGVAGAAAQGSTASQAPPPRAQVLSGSLLGGVPTGQVTPEPLALSLKDAVDRALQSNLAVRLQQESVHLSEGTRAVTRSDLLPNISARLAATRQQINLAAFGFTRIPGIPGANLPTIVGPFNVFDVRLSVTQSLLDFSRQDDLRADSATVRAEIATLKSTRGMAAAVAAGLYLLSVAAESRIDAARTQAETADALYRLATDLKEAGIVAGIDVIRAQVQQQRQRQRLIAAQNDFEKLKLELARAIGLPIGQGIVLTDKVPYAPLSPPALDTALARAYTSRADYQAVRARADAAEADRDSAQSELLPSLHANADYGTIGQSLGTTQPTFAVSANMRVPVFEGKRQQAHLVEADARLRERQSELADHRARVDYEVRAALLDLRSADEQVQVTQAAVTLANQELEQARDRFSAGVASNIEVIQAQDAVASASEQYISILYAHNLAKIALATALGVVDESAAAFIGGSIP
jgi:outer membrane protein TolC